MEWIDDELCLVNSGEITHVFERSPTGSGCYVGASVGLRPTF